MSSNAALRATGSVFGILACATCLECAAITHANDYTTNQCATNLDCIQAHNNDDNWICRKSDHTCQGLLSADCQQVLGASFLQDDSTTLIAATFALSGANAPIGQNQLVTTNMALHDFATSYGGIPSVTPGGKPRQIAVLVCDDQASNDAALRSVTHAVEDLGVQAIYGPQWSGPAINFLNNETLPHGILVVATGTTSPDITTLDKKGLFFRTVESTAIEDKAIAALGAGLQAAIVQATPALQNNLHVAITYKGDAFGKGTATALLPLLTLNGVAATDPANSAKFLNLDYGNPSNVMADPLNYEGTAMKVQALAPEIDFNIGTGEALTVMADIEQGWPAGVSKPNYVYTHAAMYSATPSQVQAAPDPTLQKRVMGVMFASLNAAFNEFSANFISAAPAGYSPNAFGVNTTYDAVYALVYALVSIGSKPPTGANIAAGFANLLPAPGATPIAVGPSNINMAFSLLTQGQAIDLQGISGPLDWDANGDVVQENQVWCVPIMAGQVGFPVFTGYGFDLNAMPTGSFADVSTKCGVLK